jgi:hypothetical protein
MPTCLEIIARAYQKAKIIGTGESPSAAEAADGLEELKSLYEQWAANGMFGRLADVSTGDDYEASEGERITVTDGATVTIPSTIEDDGTDYPPFFLSLIEVIDVDAQTVNRWLYDNGAWVDLNDLTLAYEAPLASRGRAGLSACLAMALADEFGGTIGPSVARQAASFRMSLALKLGGDAPRTAPDYM